MKNIVANALVSVPAGDLDGHRVRLAEHGIREFGEAAKPTAEAAITRVLCLDPTMDLLAVELAESDVHRAAWRINRALGPGGRVLHAPAIRTADR